MARVERGRIFGLRATISGGAAISLSPESHDLARPRVQGRLDCPATLRLDRPEAALIGTSLAPVGSTSPQSVPLSPRMLGLRHSPDRFQQ
jgi:hypothetical protein